MSQGILRQILIGADAPHEAALSWDEVAQWPAGVLDLLTRCGILREQRPASSIGCDGCEEACLEDIVFVGTGDDTRAYVACQRRDDIGRVEVPLDRLRRWQVDNAALVGIVGKAVAPGAPAEELVAGRLWRIGMVEIDQRDVEVFLARGMTWPDARPVFAATPHLRDREGAVVLALSDLPAGTVLPPGIHARSLLELLRLTGDGICLAPEQLGGTLPSSRKRARSGLVPFRTPPGTTWEQVCVEFVNDEMVRVTAGGNEDHRSFDELGFAKRQGRTLVPNDVWGLLLLMAKGDGRLGGKEAFVPDPGGWDSTRQRASRLRTGLRRAFPGVPDDPLMAFRRARGYESRFRLFRRGKD